MGYISNALESSPFEFLSLTILGTLFLYLVYENYTFRRSQVNRQVSSRIEKTEEEKKKFNIMEIGSARIREHEEKIKLELEKAHILFTVQEYFTFMTIGMIMGAVIGFIVFPLGAVWKVFFMWLPSPIIVSIFARLLAGTVLCWLGYKFPKLWLVLLIRKRRKLLETQLTDALLNIADAMKSGHVIQEAIRIVGEEMAYPIGNEFQKAHSEIEAGKSLEAALQDMKKRVDLPDFEMAINAMEIQFEVGGKLEPLLRNMVKIINERTELRKEIEKTIAGSKTIGYVLLAAPVLFVAMFSMMDANTYLAMLKNPVGILMLLGALAFYSVAAFFIVYIIRGLEKET